MLYLERLTVSVPSSILNQRAQIPYCLPVSTKEIDDLRQNVKEQDQNNITENVFKNVSFLPRTNLHIVFVTHIIS
jgi:hypothetical protein